MAGDLNDLLQQGEGVAHVDLTQTPMTCDICPDVETHVRLALAARAQDADDLLYLAQVLGLAASPPPKEGETNAWGKRRPRDRRRRSKSDTNTNEEN